MAVSSIIASDTDIRAFIDEYFKAWEGTDENRILSYYAETVSLEIPGTLINGKAALRDQFVRPFVAGFPGNRHIVKNMIFGKNVVVVEWSFEAAHKGAFAWHRSDWRSGEVAGLRGVRIRPNKSTDHRGPYLFRRHNITQADFITSASGVAESSDILVRFAHLSKDTHRSVIRLRRP